jgi:hypothetical protein
MNAVAQKCYHMRRSANQELIRIVACMHAP